jgi:hypothetical protein
MSELTRKIVDFAYDDQAKEARETFYSALHDKVMAHLESQKQSIAQGILSQEEVEVNEGSIADLPNIGLGGDHPGPFGVYHDSGDKLKIVSKHKTLDSAVKHVNKLRKKSGKDDHWYKNLLAHKSEEGKVPKHFHEEVESE